MIYPVSKAPLCSSRRWFDAISGITRTWTSAGQSRVGIIPCRNANRCSSNGAAFSSTLTSAAVILRGNPLPLAVDELLRSVLCVNSLIFNLMFLEAEFRNPPNTLFSFRTMLLEIVDCRLPIDCCGSISNDTCFIRLCVFWVWWFVFCIWHRKRNNFRWSDTGCSVAFRTVVAHNQILYNPGCFYRIMSLLTVEYLLHQ